MQKALIQTKKHGLINLITIHLCLDQREALNMKLVLRSNQLFLLRRKSVCLVTVIVNANIIKLELMFATLRCFFKMQIISLPAKHLLILCGDVTRKKNMETRSEMRPSIQEKMRLPFTTACSERQLDLMSACSTLVE